MYLSIINKSFVIAIVTILLFANSAIAADSSTRQRRPAGVSPDVAKVTLLDGELRRGYNQAIENAAVNKPSSSAFLSCFAPAAEINAKASSDLFSGDFSNQAATPINDGLESIKDSFSFDNIVSYDASISASVGVTVDLGISASAGNDSGPTIKGVSCGEMQNKWITIRNEGAKEYPSYKEKLAGSTEGDETFKKSWEDSSDDLSSKMDERKTLSSRDKSRILLFEGPDIPYNDRKDLCKILNFLNLKGDCTEGEINGTE